MYVCVGNAWESCTEEDGTSVPSRKDRAHDSNLGPLVTNIMFLLS